MSIRIYAFRDLRFAFRKSKLAKFIIIISITVTTAIVVIIIISIAVILVLPYILENRAGHCALVFWFQKDGGPLFSRSVRQKYSFEIISDS